MARADRSSVWLARTRQWHDTAASLVLLIVGILLLVTAAVLSRAQAVESRRHYQDRAYGFQLGVAPVPAADSLIELEAIREKAEEIAPSEEDVTRPLDGRSGTFSPARPRWPSALRDHRLLYQGRTGWPGSGRSRNTCLAITVFPLSPVRHRMRTPQRCSRLSPSLRIPPERVLGELASKWSSSAEDDADTSEKADAPYTAGDSDVRPRGRKGPQPPNSRAPRSWAARPARRTSARLASRLA
jgi:hypothetical protein